MLIICNLINSCIVAEKEEMRKQAKEQCYDVINKYKSDINGKMAPKHPSNNISMREPSYNEERFAEL